MSDLCRAISLPASGAPEPKLVLTELEPPDRPPAEELAVDGSSSWAKHCGSWAVALEAAPEARDAVKRGPVYGCRPIFLDFPYPT